MNQRISNTLIIIVIGFILFSVTLALMLSFISFNPLKYEITTNNISCNIQNITMLQEELDSTIPKLNSLLKPNVFLELVNSQKERTRSLVTRSLTEYDVKFLQNCEKTMFKKVQEKQYLAEFEKVNTTANIFSNFETLQKGFDKTQLSSSKNVNVDINWEQLLDNLSETSEKEMMRKEILRFFNVSSSFFTKEVMLKLMFAIVKNNSLDDNVVAVVKGNTSELWQYMIVSDIFNDYANINSQFLQGYWSADNRATVIIHEYGHALENYYNSLILARDRFNEITYPCNDPILNNRWKYFRTGCNSNNSYIFKRNTEPKRNQIVSDYFVEWLAKQANITEIFQKRLFAWTVVRSNYGRTTNFRELFAEGFSQWLLTPLEQRTVNWVLLNRFFTEELKKFNPLKDKF